MSKLNIIMSSVNSIYRIDPMRIVVSILNCIAQVANNLFMSIFLLKFIFDAFFLYRDFTLLVQYVSIQVIFQLLFHLYSEWYFNIFIKKSDYKIREKIQLEIHNKYIKYDSIVFNEPVYYDKYNWVNENSAENLISVYDSIINYTQELATLLLTGGIFAYFDPIVAIFVVISCAVVFSCGIKQNSNYYRKHKETHNSSRYNDYVKRVYYLPQYREDLRMNQIGEVLEKTFENNHKKIIFEQGIANKRIFVVDVLSKIAYTTLGGNLPYVFIGLNAILHSTYTVSELALLINVIIKFRSSLNSILTIIPQLKKNAMYLKDYYEFMDYEPEIKENEEGIIAKCGANSLDIKNVSFSYDGSNMVLKNINLSIKAGEKIAIVGHNGAGKSTLIKLLLRLYLPQNGQIELDHIPASEYKLNSYRDRFGVAFQNSVIYAANVAENVMMRPVNLAEDAEIVSQSLKKSGIYECIERCSSGIASIMTKEFDEEGLELSGGQIQKIALARVFAKDSGIIILDEPSSALDPISEHEMYRNMLGLSSGRTFIVISHRLSITKNVDRIVLLENGEIVECGSHNELIAKNGKYAKMWNVQAKQFS